MRYSTRLSLRSLLCLHQFSGNGFQRRTFPFLRAPDSLRASATSNSSRGLNRSRPPTHSLTHWLPGWRPSHTNLLLFSLPFQDSTVMSLSLILRPTVSRPVCRGIKHPSGAYDKIFITVRQLRVCWCGTLSLTRGQVRRLQLLLALASAVIFGSESHILLSQIRDFPFCRLLRLAGLRWR
jgi:hypothetical protein